jgi:hypothetical protein
MVYRRICAHFPGDGAPGAGIRREESLVPGLNSVVILPSGGIIPHADLADEQRRVPQDAAARVPSGGPAAFSMSPPYATQSSTVLGRADATVRLEGMEGPMRNTKYFDACREA